MKRYIGWGPGGSREQVRLSLWSWGAYLPGTWMCSPTCKLSEPHTIEIFMEASSRRHDQPIPFLTLLPFWENGGQGWKFQASNHSLVFLVTTPHSGAIQGPMRVTSLEQKTLLLLRKLRGFQEFYARNWEQRLICIYFLLLHTWWLSWVGWCCG